LAQVCRDELTLTDLSVFALIIGFLVTAAAKPQGGLILLIRFDAE
jgi:hypothetical protein